LYVEPNYPTKKALREAVRNGDPMYFYQPGLGPKAPRDGRIFVEGPHYPEPHRWYAQVTIADGKPVRVQ
jgi:hypothetical protein